MVASDASIHSTREKNSSSTTSTTSPVKRPSPESKEADEPRRKKLFLQRSEEEDANLIGYSKIPLPVVEFNPTRIRSSRSNAIPEAELVNPESSAANKVN
ncbi:hypothetical protein ARALYDRAFT_899152 [Arabidopsis lyrata subsp. lyrata]|uniref:Uncharacterized protein n=1 Tax=Arabidopsis lyrata subsp. lyrata TaxID=81972 RepID=D7L6T5_ARALL|nr:hypothetical protein ARALYDRAFT_899152 [Arabidopsis lyrata subsp. lyrata]